MGVERKESRESKSKGKTEETMSNRERLKESRWDKENLLVNLIKMQEGIYEH